MPVIGELNQKHLRGETTQAEKDALLDSLLKFFNQICINVREMKILVKIQK